VDRRLRGPRPPGADCDGQIVPIVTGTINPDVLGDLADRYPGATGPAHDNSPSDLDAGEQTLGRARRAAAGLTIAEALRLLSGPAGLAARLRNQLTGPAATISLPLDIGAAADIPAHLRRAITATSTVASPAVTSPRWSATSTTCAPAPTAARRQSATVVCSAASTI
jgi:hypothetical protein